MQKEPWHRMEILEVLSKLKVDKMKGLLEREAVARLSHSGINVLKKRKGSSPLKILLSQFQDFMVIVLMVATLVSGFLGEVADALTILAIIIVNAFLGFIQEFKAERSLEALKELTAPTARVLRNGQEVEMPARELVPGDIVFIETGDRIPADIRLIECAGLEINESALTGESIPVHKGIETLKKDGLQIGDLHNMSFMGTVVTRGRGRGVVVNTGMNTEIGKIADVIQETKEEETPLQNRLEELGKWLVNLCLGLSGMLVVLGLLRGESIKTMFFTGVSLAVAAIPEGLPAIVTISLALGVQRMIRRNAIVRRLPAVETLGCVTVICSDKTGTLTQNEMTVSKIFAGGSNFEISGIGYTTVGEFKENTLRVTPNKSKDLKLALKIGALCNDAVLQGSKKARTNFVKDKGMKMDIIGDPTEAALLVVAQKGGLKEKEFRSKFARLKEVPFDSERKRMTVVCKTPEGKVRSYVKGAPDVLIGFCEYIMEFGKVRRLNKKDKEKINTILNEMTSEALRVLAVAYKDIDGSLRNYSDENLEEDLIFVGLMGMNDPPRDEVKDSIRVARRAGIRTIMITGDYKNTAEAIGQELGLLSMKGASELMTGQEIDDISDEELANRVLDVNVYARVSPHHKLRIVRALKERGHIVAMTGDGVNDAPAIKEADVGIAMGLTGTDVTKEASAVILTDDNYNTIVSAIEEGRAIYDNIRKFIRYLLSCNIGELLTMLFSILLGLPLPLIPIQILWMNLVTDGLPAIALGVDPPDHDIMNRPPRSSKEGIFARGLLAKILVQGLSIGLCTVAVSIMAIISNRGGIEYVRTMTFCTLVMCQLIYVFSCRFERYTLFSWEFFSNKYLLVSVFFSILMQLAVVYFPDLAMIFETVPLDLSDWSIVIIFSTGSVAITGTVRTLKNAVTQLAGMREF